MASPAPAGGGGGGGGGGVFSLFLTDKAERWFTGSKVVSVAAGSYAELLEGVAAKVGPGCLPAELE